MNVCVHVSVSVSVIVSVRENEKRREREREREFMWEKQTCSQGLLFFKWSYSLFAIFCLNKFLPSIIVSLIFLYICAFIDIR